MAQQIKKHEAFSSENIITLHFLDGRYLAMGWGDATTELNHPATILRVTSLKKWSFPFCLASLFVAHKKMRVISSQPKGNKDPLAEFKGNLICTAPSESKDGGKHAMGCRGDSGGPLVARSRGGISEKAILVGVASMAYGPCVPLANTTNEWHEGISKNTAFE
jgi:hypothetical protein